MVLVRKRALDARQGGLIERKFAHLSNMRQMRQAKNKPARLGILVMVAAFGDTD
jgi:hypothetical protein